MAKTKWKRPEPQTEQEKLISLRAEMIAHQMHEWDRAIAELEDDIRSRDVQVWNLNRLATFKDMRATGYDREIARLTRLIAGSKRQIAVVKEMKAALQAINNFKPRQGMYYSAELKRSVFIPGRD